MSSPSPIFIHPELGNCPFASDIRAIQRTEFNWVAFGAKLFVEPFTYQNAIDVKKQILALPFLQEKSKYQGQWIVTVSGILTRIFPDKTAARQYLKFIECDFLKSRSHVFKIPERNKKSLMIEEQSQILTCELDSEGRTVRLFELPPALKTLSKTTFGEMYEMRKQSPVLEKVITCNKIAPGLANTSAHRAYQTYGKAPALCKDELKSSYMFADLDHPITGELKDVPEVFQPYLRYMLEFTEGKANQMTINWYENGEEFTPMHSDWTQGLAEASCIYTMTFTPEEDSEECRVFRVKGRGNHKGTIVDVFTTHGSIIEMNCGKEFQDNYVHGRWRDPSKTAPSISLSFRAFI